MTSNAGATSAGLESQVFTARLTGRPLLDSDGRAIGRVRDVVIGRSRAASRRVPWGWSCRCDGD